MAQFEKKRLDLTDINGGIRFENGDIVTAEDFNAPIEAVAYAQELAEQASKNVKKYYLHEVVLSGATIDNSKYLRLYILNTQSNAINSVDTLTGYWMGSKGVPLFVRFLTTANPSFIDIANSSPRYTPIYIAQSGANTVTLVTVNPSGEVIANSGLAIVRTRATEYNL